MSDDVEHRGQFREPTIAGSRWRFVDVRYEGWMSAVVWITIGLVTAFITYLVNLEFELGRLGPAVN